MRIIGRMSIERSGSSELESKDDALQSPQPKKVGGKKTRHRKGASLGDVARVAGVSPQTASRVSTGSTLVTAQTEARVREVMDQLGYVPNLAARALRRGQYKAIGVVTQQLERTGESLTTAGIVAIAAELGYSVSVVQISNSESTELKHSLDRLPHLPIDGLIIVRIGQAKTDRVILPQHLPVVACDSKLEGVYPVIIGDQVQGVRDLMGHLIGLGHRIIHYVAGPLDSHPTFVRQEAWESCLREADLPLGRVWQGDWTIDSGYAVGLEIAEDPDVTAVFCANDEMAFGVMRALSHRGIRVPDDISVAGFDGGELSRFVDPPLTTVRQEFKQVARRAVDRLMEQMAGNPPSLEPEFTPVSMLVRDSTAPPSPARLKTDATSA